jgi:hypothetical protein
VDETHSPQTRLFVQAAKAACLLVAAQLERLARASGYAYTRLSAPCVRAYVVHAYCAHCTLFSNFHIRAAPACMRRAATVEDARLCCV